MGEYQRTAQPLRSPWGKVDFAEELAPGIWWVTTPSHGGAKLSAERQRDMPVYLRQSAGWYEEDCAWALAALVYPEPFQQPGCFINPPSMERIAERVRNWFPDAYEAHFGVTLQPGESYLRDNPLPR